MHSAVVLVETKESDTVTAEATNEAHFLSNYSNEIQGEEETTSRKPISFQV
jgi:hypothetical protein